MLAIRVEQPDALPWRRTFALPQVMVGSAPECDLVLPGLASKHARFIFKNERVVVVALDHASVRVDQRTLRAPCVVSPDTAIRLGPYSAWVSAMAPETVEQAPLVQIRGPEEQALLDAIERGDRASRLVYADWLESRGDDQRAEYLRLQATLFGASADDPTFGPRGDRLRELAAQIGDLAWRSRVAMQHVEACAFEVSCPREWDAMAPTDREGVRHCSSCDRDVVYCGTAEEARGWAALGSCVALDVVAPRWDRDLAPPFGIQSCDACEIDVGNLRHCPRCGAYIGRMQMRGMIA